MEKMAYISNARKGTIAKKLINQAAFTQQIY